MDSFVSRKRRRVSPPTEACKNASPAVARGVDDEDSTDFKLALLASLHPQVEQAVLLEALLATDGSVEAASHVLNGQHGLSSPEGRVIKAGRLGYQSSLSSMGIKCTNTAGANKDRKLMSKKGKTLHLYAPEDIEVHTPCSIIHNFLPSNEADALLRELLAEAPTFEKGTFTLFDKEVTSPHTMCFYVDSFEEAQRQQTEYVYQGSYIKV